MNTSTFTLASGATLVITTSDAVVALSVKARGGTVLITGNQPFKNLGPTADILEDSQCFDLQAPSSSPMNITIQGGTGSADIFIASAN